MIIAGATLLNDKRWEQEAEVQALKVKQGSNYGKRLTCLAPVQDLLVWKRRELWASVDTELFSLMRIVRRVVELHSNLNSLI